MAKETPWFRFALWQVRTACCSSYLKFSIYLYYLKHFNVQIRYFALRYS
jgi:hypothetical protein